MYHLKRNSGGATRDRTADLLRARQALSQLSYSPSILRRPWVPHHPNQRAFSQIGFLSWRRLLVQMSQFINSIGGKVVGLGGFEPPTSPLSGVRSNQLSYRPESAGL